MAGAGYRTFAVNEVLTASNVQSYLQDQVVMTFADSSTRSSTVTAPTEGMISYLKDSNVLETYSGSAWQRQTGGLVPVIPATVTIATGSGSANAIGQVSFTGATSVSLNSIFTSAYTNYAILFTLTASSAAAANINFRLRVSGTDNSASAYQQGGGTTTQLAASGTYSQASATSWKIAMTRGSGTNIWASSKLDVFSPQKTDYTAYTANSVYNDGTSLFGAYIGGLHQVASAFDGFSFYSGSGTFGGTIQVFGYNE